MADRKPIPFELHRDTDVSGVSGTGKVAEGAIFSDGEAVIHWLGEWPTTTPHPKGITSIRAVHGHGGATRVVLPDDPAARLARIADAHSKHVTGGGLTDGDWERAPKALRKDYRDLARATLAVLGGPTEAQQEAAALAAEVRALTHQRDRYREAWRSACRRRVRARTGRKS